MPVGVIMDFGGGDAAAYDRVLERMQLGGRTPAGCQFHAAGAHGDGWRVIDVWDDPATFERFAQEQIGPHAGAEGFPEPKVEMLHAEESFDVRDGRTIALVQVVRLSGMDGDTFRDADSDIRDDREPPAGCLFHVNGPSDDGWMVVDAWTDKEKRDAFIAAKVGPAMQARGVTPPAIEDLDVHSVLAPR